MTSVMTSSSVRQRKVAAIVGAIVADAAAQPLHWIYDLSKLKALIEETEEIEFRNPSANPFYRIPTGSNTCYGDEAFVMLRSLVESQGLSIANLKEETYRTFGPESAYEDKENANYQVGKEDKINVKKSLPIYSPWRNGCIKDFLSAFDQGLEETGSTTDDQIDCAIRVIPLVCLYAGHPDMLTQVERGLRVTQASDMAIASALALSRVLEQFILYQNPEDLFHTVIQSMEGPNNSNPQEMDKAVIGQIRQVFKVKDVPHHEVVPAQFKNN